METPKGKIIMVQGSTDNLSAALEFSNSKDGVPLPPSNAQHPLACTEFSGEDPPDLPVGFAQAPAPPSPQTARQRRKSDASCGSMRTSAWSSCDHDGVDITQTMLIDNATARALDRSRLPPRPSAGSVGEITIALTEGGHIDWTSRTHVRRMKELCRFIRRLFNSVKVEVNNRSETVICDDGRTCSLQRMRTRTRIFVESSTFSVFFVFLIIYALFGPDFIACYGHTAQDNAAVATINSAVLLFFLLELTLNCWVTEGYRWSARFCVDLFATVTMIGDTWIMSELVDSDVAAAGRGSRLMRMVRMGRSSRLIRLMRMSRTVHVLRLVPRIQRRLEGSAQELASLLLHKRLWHIFQYLDETGSGELSDEHREYFFTALKLEFPTEKGDQKLPRAITLARQRTKVGRMVSLLRTNTNVSGLLSRNTHEWTVGCFEEILHQALPRPECKKALDGCFEDIESMRSSCEAVDKTISAVMLKVCMAAIITLIGMSLLISDRPDQSRGQDLALIEDLTRHALINLDNFCTFVRSFEARHQLLLLLIVNLTVYWDHPNYSPCTKSPIRASDFHTTADPVGNCRSKINSIRRLEKSEFSSWCHPDTDCKNNVRSVALYDMSKEARKASAHALMFTAVALTLIVALVMFFTLDTTRLANRHLMHPLWDVLDDMCSVKIMEVVSENDAKRGPCAANMVSKRKRHCKFCGDTIPIAEELVQVSAAISNLKRAMRSWVKFVPKILLKNIVDAGIEAGLGVSRLNVTVFFCDIKDFEKISRDMDPNGMLDLLDEVFHSITSAVEDYDGQMLEFIGDELLAVFNAPAKVPQHWRKAIRAAVASQELVSQIGQADVRLNIGLHRANVLAGNLGSNTRMKYGVLGDGVNTTARIKSLNTRLGTSILASPTVVDESGFEDFVIRPIGKLVLKGRTTPTLTYEVLGLTSTTHTRVQRAAELHRQAFDLFLSQRFSEASLLFVEANGLLNYGDKPSMHMAQLCEDNRRKPPPSNWDGSEFLTKKAW